MRTLNKFCVKIRINIFILLIVITIICCSNEKRDRRIYNEISRVHQVDPIFTFPDYNIQVRIPKNWGGERLSKDMFVFKTRCHADAQFCPNIVARFVPIEEELTLENCAELFFTSFKGRYKKTELISSLDKEVGGLKMKIIDYKIFENNTMLGGTTAFLILQGQGRIFTLSIMAENDEKGSYVNYRRLFEKILNSIESIK